MKKKLGTAFVLMCVMAVLLLAVGCSDKSTSGTGGNTDGGVGSLQIVLGDDTLQYLPGDSASTTVSIVVRDRSGVVMQGVRVAISLTNASLGFIEYVDTQLRDTSNGLGRVECVYRSYAQQGDNVINVNASGVVASVPISVREARDVVGSINLDITPDRVNTSPSGEDSVQCLITLRDVNHQGIANVNVQMSTDLGRFTPPPATDESGRTVTWWYPDGESGEGWIYVRAGGKSDSSQVHVELTLVTGVLSVSTNISRINADGCVTNATITATLEDAYGVAVPNDTIYFGTPGGVGSISSFGITDSSGVVQRILCGGGIPNSIDPNDSALVIARYPKWGLADTVHVRIDPAANVGNVILSASRYSGTAGQDSIALQLLAAYDNGNRINGLFAYLYKECGTFAVDSVEIRNGAFISPVYWTVCTNVTPPSDPAEMYAMVRGVESNHLQFIIDPGPARMVSIVAELPVVPVNGTVGFIAQVQDSLANNVRDGEAVTFTTTSTSGTLTPQSPISTDINGQARVTLNTGVTAGSVTVKVELGAVAVDSTVIFVTSGSANTILLEVTPPSVEVAGTGGQSSTTLTARVRDANNNAAPDGIRVGFRIIGGELLGGININNHGFSDSSTTANGIAVATLNAGTIPGPFSVQACCVAEDGQTICASASNGSVVAGPPASIDIGVDEVGDDAGAAWDLEVNALVLDQYNNAVRCSVAVFFEVDPDTAQILSANVIVCNADKNGDHRPGVAYTILRYNSQATFETISITARTAAPGAVSATELFTLPMQEPLLDLICTPNAWHYGQRTDPSQIQCVAMVQDGNSVPINGATVVFTTQRGAFFPTATGGSEIINGRRNTGPVANPLFLNGQAFVWLRAFEQYVFASPLETERTVEVRAEVEGYGEAVDAVIVNFQR
ncbi:hypothetical protein HZB60_07495 [candidate division KSB1 bacterium]|nr:hypothetical protein [candidate division KSB1 bacterium]